jgi:hypothetical protein
VLPAKGTGGARETPDKAAVGIAAPGANGTGEAIARETSAKEVKERRNEKEKEKEKETNGTMVKVKAGKQ